MAIPSIRFAIEQLMNLKSNRGNLSLGFFQTHFEQKQISLTLDSSCQRCSQSNYFHYYIHFVRITISANTFRIIWSDKFHSSAEFRCESFAYCALFPFRNSCNLNLITIHIGLVRASACMRVPSFHRWRQKVCSNCLESTKRYLKAIKM